MLSWECDVFCLRILLDLNMWNNQKTNIDWKLCFICQEQEKDNLRNQVIITEFVRVLAVGSSWCHMLKCHFYSTWWSRIWKLSYWKRSKVPQGLCKSLWQLQSTKSLDNQKNISEADNSVEPSPSLSRSFRKKKSPVLCCAICNEEDLSENLHAVGSYHGKGKWLMALNSDNPSLLSLISTKDLAANKIFYHASCYKSM